MFCESCVAKPWLAMGKHAVVWYLKTRFSDSISTIQENTKALLQNHHPRVGNPWKFGWVGVVGFLKPLPYFSTLFQARPLNQGLISDHENPPNHHVNSLKKYKKLNCLKDQEESGNLWVGLPTPFYSWKPHQIPDQPCPISNQNGQNLYPFSDQQG